MNDKDAFTSERFVPPEEDTPPKSKAKKGAPRSPIKLIWHGDDDDEPLLEWLIEDMFYKEGVGLIAGRREMISSDTNDDDVATQAKLLRERLRCLILARCPEVTAADLDDLAAPESDEPEPMADVLAQVTEIIEMLEARLDRLERGGSIEDRRQLQ